MVLNIMQSIQLVIHSCLLSQDLCKTGFSPTKWLNNARGFLFMMILIPTNFEIRVVFLGFCRVYYSSCFIVNDKTFSFNYPSQEAKLRCFEKGENIVNRHFLLFPHCFFSPFELEI